MCSAPAYPSEKRCFNAASSKNERMIQPNEWVFSTIVIEKALISQNMSEKVANERDKYILNFRTDSMPGFSSLKGTEMEIEREKGR